MLNRNRKENRTLISLTSFHKRYVDAHIDNLSQFVRDCITKEMQKNYGEIRQLEIVKSLLHTKRWDSIAVLIKNGNLASKIIEYVEDVKIILQKACQIAVDIKYNDGKDTIIYHISPNSINVDVEVNNVDEENKDAFQMLIYSHYLSIAYKQLALEDHKSLIDAVNYLLAMLFMDKK